MGGGRVRSLVQLSLCHWLFMAGAFSPSWGHGHELQFFFGDSRLDKHLVSLQLPWEDRKVGLMHVATLIARSPPSSFRPFFSPLPFLVTFSGNKSASLSFPFFFCLFLFFFFFFFFSLFRLLALGKHRRFHSHMFGFWGCAPLGVPTSIRDARLRSGVGGDEDGAFARSHRGLGETPWEASFFFLLFFVCLFFLLPFSFIAFFFFFLTLPAQKRVASFVHGRWGSSGGLGWVVIVGNVVRLPLSRIPRHSLTMIK